jgi:hypothetical protein
MAASPRAFRGSAILRRTTGKLSSRGGCRRATSLRTEPITSRNAVLTRSGWPIACAAASVWTGTSSCCCSSPPAQLSWQLPTEIFFDDDLLWHRQRFGKPGVYSHSPICSGDGLNLYGLHVSDLVSAFREGGIHATRVEGYFAVGGTCSSTAS